MATHASYLHGDIDGAHHDQFEDDGSALRAAHLASPSFKEPWRDGSPLNWCEFIARCQGRSPARSSGGRASVPQRIPER